MKELTIEDEDFALLRRVMQKVDLFAKLPIGQLEQLCQTMQLNQFDTNETLIKQGAQADFFFILQSGQVKVCTKNGFFSKEHELARLGAGDFFGEMALFGKSKRNASVTALATTRAFILRYQDFRRFLQQNTTLKTMILEMTKERKLTNSLRDL
jgi:CRP-like cAMP-binding protein